MRTYCSGFADQIEQFIYYRKASGSWNESNYGYYLWRFDKYCAEKYPGMPLMQTMVDEWCARKGQELNRSTNIRVRVIRVFIKYLRTRKLTDVEEPHLLTNEPFSYIPHAFTQEELANFFYECDHIDQLPTKRNTQLARIICPVLFRLLYSSGIRTTEARLLQRCNVDLTHGVLNIQESKGLDQHYVALHPSMLELLALYDRTMDRIQPNRKYFFQSSNGECFNHTWLEQWFRLLWQKANGPDVRATAYELRHHYAITNINSWNHDSFEFSDKLYFLSKSMGHRQVISTLHYYSIVPRLANTIKAASEDGFNKIVAEVHYEEE